MLAALYLICHIDRANIGNAKIEGMVEDLNMTGVQYNTILAICEYLFHEQYPRHYTTRNTDIVSASLHSLRSF